VNWSLDDTDRLRQEILRVAIDEIPHKSERQLYIKIGAICEVDARTVQYWYKPKPLQRRGTSMKLHCALALSKHLGIKL
jgi:hypothetical protein